MNLDYDPTAEAAAIATLGEQLGVAGEGFAETVARFNAALEKPYSEGVSGTQARKERRRHERAEAKVQAKMRQFSTQLEEISA